MAWLLFLTVLATVVHTDITAATDGIVQIFDVLNSHVTELGCYYVPQHNTDTTTLDITRFLRRNRNDMTNEICIKECSSPEWTYALLERGNRCYCARTLNGLTENPTKKLCRKACTGDPSKMCGGKRKKRFTVHKLSNPPSLSQLMEQPMCPEFTAVPEGASLVPSGLFPSIMKLQCNCPLIQPSGIEFILCQADRTWTTPTGFNCLGPARDDCYELRNGTAAYEGHVGITVSGKNCRPWRDVIDTKEFTAEDFPQADVDTAGNFCRDPDGTGHPFCYVDTRQADEVDWEPCPIRRCDLDPCAYHLPPSY